MNKLLCNHERQYCHEKKSKFFQTGFGEVVVTQPRFTFQKHFEVNEDKVYVFRNRGIEDDEVFEEIINESAISPIVSNIEEEDWRGNFGVFWT